MTLGSLFDGIAGFPLAGAMHGVTPVWASEIEPFPLAVSRERFPDMQQLGSVTEIRGDEIEPVDIVTFGSPCQDLSVAGKQAGIHEGTRSSLFFEAVRIIKEMRRKDEQNGRTGVNVRPRYAVWENVPGAFSSNKGQDFRAVLQALAQVKDPDAAIPEPPKGKWSKAGCVVGDGYSIAWRTYDAQFWEVPQRRKRIYLVADFGGERADGGRRTCAARAVESRPQMHGMRTAMRGRKDDRRDDDIHRDPILPRLRGKMPKKRQREEKRDSMRRDDVWQEQRPPAWCKTDGVYMPPKVRYEDMTLEQVRRGLCALARQDGGRCPKCKAPCGAGRRYMALTKKKEDERT